MRVEEDRNGDALQFSPGWGEQRIDQWLRGLFPQLFTWLDQAFPLQGGKIHWRLTRKHYSTLHICNPDEVTGKELVAVRGSSARSYKDHCLWFGAFLCIDLHRVGLTFRDSSYARGCPSEGLLRLGEGALFEAFGNGFEAYHFAVEVIL